MVPRALAVLGGLGTDRGAKRLIPGEARLRADPPVVMFLHEVRTITPWTRPSLAAL